MSKIAIEEVQSVLEQHKVKDTAAIIKDLEQILEELKAEKEIEKENKPKYEYIVVLHEPSGKLIADKIDEIVSAFVIQQEEGEDSGLALSKIVDAAKTQNENAKSKKTRLENIREIFDGLKPKFLKEKKIKIKTKESVRVVLTDGKLGNIQPIKQEETE